MDSTSQQKNGNEQFVLTNEGEIHKFLGIEITQLDKKGFKISQPFLVDQIIYILNIDNDDYGMKKTQSQHPSANLY